MQSSDKRRHSSPRSFMAETTSFNALRGCSCGKKPLASAFSVQVGWGRLQVHSPLSNCPPSMTSFPVETVFGCLVLRRRRQHSSLRSCTSNYKYLKTEIRRLRLKKSFRNSRSRNSPVLSCSTTSRHRGMRLAGLRNRSAIFFES